jgi:hypothetical protein
VGLAIDLYSIDIDMGGITTTTTQLELFIFVKEIIQKEHSGK